jgi:hypothetical protein
VRDKAETESKNHPNHYPDKEAGHGQSLSVGAPASSMIAANRGSGVS